MSNHVIFAAVRRSLHKVVADYLAALDGISDDDLSTWKPEAASRGGGEMNTLSGLSVHTAEAGAWMVCHQVFGQEFDRSRVLDFTATATRAEIDAFFASFLQRFDDAVATDPDIDLAGPPASIRPALPDWDRAAWLMHAIDHTAEHLGHAQITRQVWLAERGS